MNEQIKYIHVPLAKDMQTTDVIDESVNVELRKTDYDCSLLRYKGDKMFFLMRNSHMLDIAYLLIETHFRIIANDKNTEIEIKIKRD